MLAEIDITEQLKDPGLIQWFIYAYIALTIYDKVSGMVQKRKAADVRVIGGEMEVSSKIEFANAKDTARKFEEINQKIDNLIESLATQHKAALKAGEDRVRNLGEVMDAETAEIKHALEHLGDKMERIADALHEKVNGVANNQAGDHAKIEILMAGDYITRSTAARKPR